MSSLQTKLSLGLLGSLIVLFALQWLAASFFLRSMAEQQVTTRLEQDAETLLAALMPMADDGLQVQPRYIAPMYLRPFSGHYYWILTAQTHLASRSLWDRELAILPLPPGEVRVAYLPGPQGQRLFTRIAGYRKFDQNVTIATSEDLSAFEQSVRRFQRGYAAISSIALTVLILTQRWILRRSIRTLERTRRQMSQLERGEIDRLEAGVPAEIAPLVQEFNRLLVVLRQRGKRSRDALGNLAHALKTQLALLRHATEHPQLRAYPALRRQLGEPLERIRALTERELKRARLAGAAMPGQHVDIHGELERLANAVRTMYAEKPLDIEIRAAAGARFAGDTEDFLELMGNLLDNAAKYCRAHVRVTTTTPPLAIRVEDDGPGAADDTLHALTARGTRADEHLPGSGLGLAIARDVVETYGGALRLGRSDALGGFLVEATFPSLSPTA
jgi:signal transduction histidine kinase